MSLSINPDLMGLQDSSRLQQLWEVALLGNAAAPTRPASTVSDDAVVATVSVGLSGGARSAHDGLAIVQTADTTFGDVASLLRRMDQIAMVCGATADLSPVAQNALQTKFEDLQVEVKRLQAAAAWKGVDVLAGRDLTFKDVTLDGATTLAPVDVSGASVRDPSTVQNAIESVDSKRADLAIAKDRLIDGLHGVGTAEQPTVVPLAREESAGGGLSLLL